MIEKVSNSKNYIRKIESMGKGLVMFKVLAVNRRMGQNYHLFYADKRKPPLDIAINPDDGAIEYISYFVQNEVIKDIDIDIEIINEYIGISIKNTAFNKNNVHITIEKNFLVMKSGEDIWILSENIDESVLTAYNINQLISLLFMDDEFYRVILKNLNESELQEIRNSKCLS